MHFFEHYLKRFFQFNTFIILHIFLSRNSKSPSRIIHLVIKRHDGFVYQLSLYTYRKGSKKKERSHAMGDKGGKKDKEKLLKQKQAASQKKSAK